MTPQEAANNWVHIFLASSSMASYTDLLSQGKIDALRTSIGAKICTPCPSNGAQTGLSGVGTKTQQYQSGIDQGTQWNAEFLAAATASGYKFDCLCGHWYGNSANDLAADQTLIEQQVGDMVTLAAKYSIDDIVISEMGRTNADQEVRSYVLPH